MVTQRHDWKFGFLFEFLMDLKEEKEGDLPMKEPTSEANLPKVMEEWWHPLLRL